MDRRIQKTRQAIMEGFVSLMGELGFEKITIHAIAERANVNRGTVYLHFTDKYDLLEQCVQTYLELLYESCMPGNEPRTTQPSDLMLRTFEFLERNASVYATLMTNKGIPAFRKRMMEIMEINIVEYIDCSGVGAGINRDILVQFLSVAVAGLIEWWIVNSMPYPPAVMVEQLLKILEQNMAWPVPAQ